MHLNTIQPVYFSPTRTSDKIVHAIAEGIAILLSAYSPKGGF